MKHIVFVFFTVLAAFFSSNHVTIAQGDSLFLKPAQKDMVGFYVGGGIGYAAGAIGGWFIKVINDGDAGLFPLASGTILAVPMTLTGLSVGRIISKSDTPFDGSFAVIAGYSSGPHFVLPGERGQVSGIYFAVDYPQIRNWRYRTGIHYYFPYETLINGDFSKLDWWICNFDLHYVVAAESVAFYPLIGSSVHFDRQDFRSRDGNRFKSTYWKLAGNVGMGFQYTMFSNSAVYLEPRYTFYENRTGFIMVLGVRQGL